MARHRMCFIVLTMMLVCLLYGSAAQAAAAVRHGFPPDILFVDYERQGPERSFVINRFADESGTDGLNGFNRMKRSADGTGGSSATGSAASSLTAAGKDSKNSVRPVIEAKVRYCFFFTLNRYQRLFCNLL